MTDDKCTVEAVQSICVLIFIIFAMGCVTYGCTQPSYVNAEAQADRIVENNKMVACTKAGGSWMPIYRAGYQTQTGCVTKDTLPLVQQWSKD